MTPKKEGRTHHSVGVRVEIENADDGESPFGRVVEFPRFVDVGSAPITHVTIRPWASQGGRKGERGKVTESRRVEAKIAQYFL